MQGNFTLNQVFNTKIQFGIDIDRVTNMENIGNLTLLDLFKTVYAFPVCDATAVTKFVSH